MFIWYLSTFIVYISYRRAAMNDSGSGYQGATGMLDAEAEGWALRCNASNMSNVCTFFPLNLWFRHELKIPLGWGKKHRFLRTVLTFTNWIGFTISFEAFEWHSYITVIFCFQKKIHICIYAYIFTYNVFSQAAETAETGLTIASSLEAVRSTPSPTRVVGLVAARKWLLTFKATIISRYVNIDLHELLHILHTQLYTFVNWVCFWLWVLITLQSHSPIHVTEDWDCDGWGHAAFAWWGMCWTWAGHTTAACCAFCTRRLKQRRCPWTRRR